jgi:hypothetical protein
MEGTHANGIGLSSQSNAAKPRVDVLQAGASVRPGDFDGNGVPEIILQSSDGSIGLWYLRASGRQLSIDSFAVVADPSSITLLNATDLNGDGIPDLLLRFIDGSIGIWYMGGARGHTIIGFTPMTGPVEGWAPVAASDMNSDGRPDLMVQSKDGQTGIWYLGGPQGNLIVGYAPVPSLLTQKVAGLADLDNDGKPDEIYQLPDRTVGVLYLTGPNGHQVKDSATIAEASDWDVIGVTDVDGDGHPDLIIRNTDGSIAVWFLGGYQGHEITGFSPIAPPGNITWRAMAAH